MKHWCAYQERSHFEARKKLSQLGATKEETEGIISDLISEDYLNEERFACAFARGKFRIKFWGKVKIRAALRQHGVSEPNIAKALASIDGAEYEKALSLLLEKKLRTVLVSDKRKKFHLALNYAVSHGFESEAVIQQLNHALGANNYEFRT